MKIRISIVSTILHPRGDGGQVPQEGKGYSRGQPTRPLSGSCRVDGGPGSGFARTAAHRAGPPRLNCVVLSTALVFTPRLGPHAAVCTRCRAGIDTVDSMDGCAGAERRPPAVELRWKALKRGVNFLKSFSGCLFWRWRGLESERRVCQRY
jgi:hypothetical protein